MEFNGLLLIIIVAKVLRLTNNIWGSTVATLLTVTYCNILAFNYYRVDLK
jgi:hypothetical protein